MHSETVKSAVRKCLPKGQADPDNQPPDTWISTVLRSPPRFRQDIKA